MSEVAGWAAMRTVCHGCRTMREFIEQVGPHAFQLRTMIIPGEATIYRRVQTGFHITDDADTADTVVESPCPACGETENPEWLPEFVPPA